mmetsp:Transcript_17966/g.54940  ORF Transcript_17966/g.54940 Transcript_17966/m.54940 type:complete len:286 (+) Transcript_17966:556-1413(+)
MDTVLYSTIIYFLYIVLLLPRGVRVMLLTLTHHIHIYISERYTCLTSQRYISSSSRPSCRSRRSAASTSRRRVSFTSRSVLESDGVDDGSTPAPESTPACASPVPPRWKACSHTAALTPLPLLAPMPMSPCAPRLHEPRLPPTPATLLPTPLMRPWKLSTAGASSKSASGPAMALTSALRSCTSSGVSPPAGGPGGSTSRRRRTPEPGRGSRRESASPPLPSCMFLLPAPPPGGGTGDLPPNAPGSAKSTGMQNYRTRKTNYGRLGPSIWAGPSPRASALKVVCG